MKKIDATLNKHYFHSRIKNNAVLCVIACTVCFLEIELVAAQNSGFGTEKTSWHGYDRYDFVMDEQTLQITPIKAPEGEKNSVGAPAKGQRRCIVVVPKVAASGNPWSWQACYWDHRPQAEVELLRRGFHIAFITPDPGKEWDAWYTFLTEKYGFSKKPAFDGMSKGGVNAYRWATTNPDKVSCIYGENPVLRGTMVTKGNPDDNAKVPHINYLSPLAKAGVSILHVCGSLDHWLDRETRLAEKKYMELGGNFTVIIRQGEDHFAIGPQDPKPVVDFIVSKTQ